MAKPVILMMRPKLLGESGSFSLLYISLTFLLIVLVPQSESQYNTLYTNPLAPYDTSTSGLPLHIRVGGLFDESNTLEEIAFKHAVDRVSEDHTILPSRRLSPQIERLSPGDSHRAAEKVCDMMGGGITAIFGPQTPEAASHVQAICDAFEIPHVEIKWDYKVRKENYLINLAPHPHTLSKAINDLVEAYEWEEYVIIYESSESLVRLQDLIKSTQPPRKASLRQLPPGGDDYRPLLKDILRGTGFRNLVIDCTLPKLDQFFRQAQQVGLMNYEFSYIVTSLDLQTLSLEEYQYSDANITAFRLVDPEKPEVKAVVRRFNALVNSQPGGGGVGGYNYSPPHNNPNTYYPYGPRDQPRQGRLRQTRQMMQPHFENSDNNDTDFQMITTDIALIYDAVHLFSQALHVLDSSQRIDIRPISCDSTETWPHGYSIINYMKMVQVQGLTGLIQFSTSGYRTDVSLDVVQLTENGLKKVGIWDSKFVTKFNWSRPEPEKIQQTAEYVSLSNRTLVITTIMSNPFIMYKLSKTPLKGNDQYEGYVVDFAQKLSEILGFKFEIRIVGDGKYGNPDDNGVWNGMVKEVQDGVADIAIADLSVNKARESAIDFTMPFMNLGISILHTKPKAKPPSLFSFLSPFSIDVWVWTCFAFFGVSLILFIIARLSPYEWDCPHSCIEDPDELENQFTLLNSFWFTIGSLMQQGSDVAPNITPYEWTVVNCYCTKLNANKVAYINELGFLNALWIIMAGLFRQRPSLYPKATSTRMIAGIWWFFTLIMVSSYTANLASFLIVQDLEETINSLEDLPKQTKVKYGCVNGGSTAGFFSKSPFPVQKAIWANMEKYNTFAPGNADGVDRVIKGKGKYAFFAESTVLEYFVERNCELRQVGGLLDSKGYGVGLPKDSADRQAFNSAILRLHEKGVLDELKRKWWKEERKGPQCTGGDSDSVKPLALDNVGGVFLVMVVGCIIAIFFTLFEFYFKTRETAKDTGDNLNKVLKQELKFALSFAGDTKPVNQKKDSISSGNDGGSGSNQYLDLGMDNYGFPIHRSNGGIRPDGFT